MSAVLLALSLIHSASAAGEWFASGLSSVKIDSFAARQNDSTISGLKWDRETLESEILELPPPKPGAPTERKARAWLTGHLKGRGWSLLVKFEPVVVNRKTGAFKVPVTLTGNETVVPMTAVGPSGAIQQTEIKLITRVVEVPGSEIQEKRHQFFARTGVSILPYTELLNSVSVTNVGIPLELGYQWALLPGKLALGAEAGLTVWRLASAGATKSGPWTANLRAKYRFPWLKAPWIWTGEIDFLMRGMFTAGNAYGFTFLGMPAIAVGMARVLGPEHQASARITYAPLQSGFGLSFVQRAWIFELGYERDWKPGIRWTADFRFESLNFTGTAGTASVPVTYSQFALLGGVRF